MPNIKSAKKRMELSRVANASNRVKRSRIRTAVRRVREAEDPAEAQTLLRDAKALLDRAATKRLIHPRKVARMKSQMDRHVNELTNAS
jgi:small subunit ribosomal protein S20